jgi:hypothetical protein
MGILDISRSIDRVGWRDCLGARTTFDLRTFGRAHRCGAVGHIDHRCSPIRALGDEASTVKCLPGGSPSACLWELKIGTVSVGEVVPIRPYHRDPFRRIYAISAGEGTTGSAPLFVGVALIVLSGLALFYRRQCYLAFQWIKPYPDRGLLYVLLQFVGPTVAALIGIGFIAAGLSR